MAADIVTPQVSLAKVALSGGCTGSGGDEIQFGILADPSLDIGSDGYLGFTINVLYDDSNLTYVSIDGTPFQYGLPNTGTVGEIRWTGMNLDQSKEVIGADEPVLTFTMAITDSEAPYGFQVVDAQVDGTSTSDALFDFVSNTAFEKTTVTVSGDVSVVQAFGGQATSYSDLIGDSSTVKLLSLIHI